ELVIAPRTYDRDVTNTSPREAFSAEEDHDLLSRIPLVQSMYLLTDHKDAFAVDYPISLTQLKNPNPSRFKGAFRARSLAPAFSLPSLHEFEAGDPRWTSQERQHYLVRHPDPRYQELAMKLTEGLTNDYDRVLAITKYLSDTSIYTLTPNHE